jgi:hypothetical protein
LLGFAGHFVGYFFQYSSGLSVPQFSVPGFSIAEAIVVLSEAKNLLSCWCSKQQVLRFAQEDNFCGWAAWDGGANLPDFHETATFQKRQKAILGSVALLTGRDHKDGLGGLRAVLFGFWFGFCSVFLFVL